MSESLCILSRETEPKLSFPWDDFLLRYMYSSPIPSSNGSESLVCQGATDNSDPSHKYCDGWSSKFPRTSAQYYGARSREI